MTDGASLPVRSPSAHVHAHIKFSRHIGERQRLDDETPLRFEHKIILQRSPIDGDFARTCRHAHTSDRGFATARPKEFSYFSHNSTIEIAPSDPHLASAIGVGF